MVVSLPKIRTILLDRLPSITANKRPSDRFVEDVIDDFAMNNRILQLSDEFTDLTAGVRALDGMAACKVKGKIINPSDVADMDEITTDSRK